jgi:hypothetical protein
LAPEANHALADDAATYLVRLGMRDIHQSARVKKIIGALARDGDLIITPWVLRKHLFRWGLTVHDISARSGAYVFDKEETINLLSDNKDNYRSALIDGRLLRRIPNSEALFVLSNANLWDDALRYSLTEQIEDANGRASIAALLVPPGYWVDGKTLDLLFDVSRIKEISDNSSDVFDHSTWIGQCLARFSDALSGRHWISNGIEERRGS